LVYKLHAVCGVSVGIHSYDLTQASVLDINYLNDVEQDYFNSTIIGDRGYINAKLQPKLFETAHNSLDVPYRCNKKDGNLFYKPFSKARKKIETLFSLFTDQFSIMRNYAKNWRGFTTEINSKVSALTAAQYQNNIKTDQSAESSMRSLNSATGII